MNKYLVNVLFLLLGINLVGNYYLLSQYNQETQFKKRILELKEKKRETPLQSLKLEYQDSINNTVNLWLYGTSK